MQFQHLLAASRFLSPASPFACPADERSFQTDYRTGGYGFTVAVMLVGAVMALSFIIVAMLQPPDSADAGSLQFLRATIGTACALSFTALVLAPDWSMANHKLTVFAPSLIALGGLGLLLFLPGVGQIASVAFGRSTLSLILAIWLISAFCRLPLRHIMAMSLSASLFNLAGHHYQGLSQTPFLALDLLIANFTVWALTIQIEKRERLLWWQSSTAQQALRRAEQSFDRVSVIHRVQNRLMQSLGHDIRQPLSSSSIYLSLVSKAAIQSADKVIVANTERLAACLRAVESALNRLLEFEVEHLIDHDLTTSRSELTGVFSDLRYVFGPQAERLGVKLKFSSRTEVAQSARTNEAALLEILSNLIANAIKYSAIRPAGQGIVLVGVVATSEAVRIDVVDNGVGIHADLHKKIFQEGFRAPEITSRTAGSGLGLSIVESMVQRLPDHRLRLRSDPGAGTRVRLYLPVA